VTTGDLQKLEEEYDGEVKLAAELSKRLDSPDGVTDNDNGAADGSGGGDGDTEGVSATTGVHNSPSKSAFGSTKGDAAMRCRHLKGVDPAPDQLVAKIEVLEERLNDKKEQLLEKELVLDEV
jgi:hypothetical protein